jgi:hypothetical protein
VSLGNVMRMRSLIMRPMITRLLPEVRSLAGGRWNVTYQPPRQTFTAPLMVVLARGNALFPPLHNKTQT